MRFVAPRYSLIATIMRNNLRDELVRGCNASPDQEILFGKSDKSLAGSTLHAEVIFHPIMTLSWYADVRTALELFAW